MVKNLRIYNTGLIKIPKTSVHALVKAIKKELSLDISSLIINFVTEGEILQLNRTYLNHNFSTDIITFGYSESGQNIDGELFISYKEAEHNAQKYGVTFQEEISRLVIHGILHLVGYDDKGKRDKKIMKEIENELVVKFNNYLNKEYKK